MLTVLAALAVGAAILLTVLTFQMRDGRATLFGHELRLVQTGSMEPSVHAGDIVFIKTANGSHDFVASLTEGDIITFFAGGATVVTHRIVGISQGEDIIITAHGDAAEENEVQTVREDEIIGKVTYTSHVLGFIVRTLRTPVGMIFCIIVPASIVIVMEICRIVSLCKKKRKYYEA